MQAAKQPDIATISGIEDQLATAKDSLVRLQEAANDAKAEAERWRIAFEREPTAQAHTEMVVAQQRSVNAAAAAEQQQLAVQQLEDEQRRDVRAALERQLTTEAQATHKAFRDAGAEVSASIATVQRALALLAPLFAHEVAARAAGVAWGQSTLDEYLRDLREGLAPLGHAGVLAHSDVLTFTITTSLQAVPGSIR